LGLVVYDPAMDSVSDVLATVPIFSMVPKKDLAKLAKQAHDRTFPAGTQLTDQNEFGSIFTVIAEGQATVSVNGRPVRTIGPGDFFGEMALIDRTNVRSSSIVADSELRAIMLTQPVFRPFAVSHPVSMWALLELLVARLREAEGREA
jgi:CRP/FNR family transcriptional regulator, cyclic AMP receptor protein